jgi:hypothetical protein
MQNSQTAKVDQEPTEPCSASQQTVPPVVRSESKREAACFGLMSAPARGGHGAVKD